MAEPTHCSGDRCSAKKTIPHTIAKTGWTSSRTEVSTAGSRGSALAISSQPIDLRDQRQQNQPQRAPASGVMKANFGSKGMLASPPASMPSVASSSGPAVGASDRFDGPKQQQKPRVAGPGGHAERRARDRVRAVRVAPRQTRRQRHADQHHRDHDDGARRRTLAMKRPTRGTRRRQSARSRAPSRARRRRARSIRATRRDRRRERGRPQTPARCSRRVRRSPDRPASHTSASTGTA